MSQDLFRYYWGSRNGVFKQYVQSNQAQLVDRFGVVHKCGLVIGVRHLISFIAGGGLPGGRNPRYEIQILFSRQNWDLIHTWTGVAMIVIAALHLTLHWIWVANKARCM